MPRIRQQTVCPICGIGVLKRRRRKLWMRLVPGSKYYLCDWCPEGYLTVYGQSIKLLPRDQ